jgi:hypothetical protein
MDVTNEPEMGSEPVAWPVLTMNERRVLGVLVEKGKTTPDAYPMSLNSLVTGCNQKNNRDPVLHLTDVEVEEAISSLKPKALMQQITGGGRVDRFRHVLYDAWKVDKVQLAVLGELLLRGPQTEGELRGRASRMEPIADLETLRPVLKGLAERKLVVFLTEEGRRGTMLTHGFHDAEEFARFSSGAEPPSPRPEPRHSPTEPGVLQRLEQLEEAVAALQQQVSELTTRMGQQAVEDVGARL